MITEQEFKSEYHKSTDLLSFMYGQISKVELRLESLEKGETDEEALRRTFEKWRNSFTSFVELSPFDLWKTGYFMGRASK